MKDYQLTFIFYLYLYKPTLSEQKQNRLKNLQEPRKGSSVKNFLLKHFYGTDPNNNNSDKKRTQPGRLSNFHKKYSNSDSMMKFFRRREHSLSFPLSGDDEKFLNNNKWISINKGGGNSQPSSINKSKTDKSEILSIKNQSSNAPKNTINQGSKQDVNHKEIINQIVKEITENYKELTNIFFKELLMTAMDTLLEDIPLAQRQKRFSELTVEMTIRISQAANQCITEEILRQFQAQLNQSEKSEPVVEQEPDRSESFTF
jgi:hypothetical protein